jgi:hypothetical protein
MLDGQMMILSVIDSTLFSLNETASILWQAADGRTALREIVMNQIVRQFEVDANTAYNDALETVEALARHGILQLNDQPSPAENA